MDEGRRDREMGGVRGEMGWCDKACEGGCGLLYMLMFCSEDNDDVEGVNGELDLISDDSHPST